MVVRSASTPSAARETAATVGAGPLATSAADVAAAVAADAVVAAVAPAATLPCNVAPSPDWSLANSLLPCLRTPSGSDEEESLPGVTRATCCARSSSAPIVSLLASSSPLPVSVGLPPVWPATRPALTPPRCAIPPVVPEAVPDRLIECPGRLPRLDPAYYRRPNLVPSRPALARSGQLRTSPWPPAVAVHDALSTSDASSCGISLRRSSWVLTTVGALRLSRGERSE